MTLQTSVSDGRGLYDLLMTEIEPELVSSELPLLEDRYRDESDVDRAARAKRYFLAFEAYEVKLQEFIASSDDIFKNGVRIARASLEAEDRSGEDKHMTTLLDSMTSA